MLFTNIELKQRDANLRADRLFSSNHPIYADHIRQSERVVGTCFAHADPMDRLSKHRVSKTW